MKTKIKKLTIHSNGEPIAELTRTGHYALQYLSSTLDSKGNLTEKSIGFHFPITDKVYNSGGFDTFSVLSGSFPEGFLQEVLYQEFTKPRFNQFHIDAMFILPLLENSIGRLSFSTDNLEFLNFQHKLQAQAQKTVFSLNDFLKGNVFDQALRQYLNTLGLPQHTSISGYQPKLVIDTKEGRHIAKTFDSKIFNHLSLNEYICNLAAKNAGLNVPEFHLSDDQKLFIVKRFDFDESNGKFFGVEDFCSIKGVKNAEKYQGNYTFVGEAIKRLSKNPNDVGNFFQYLALSAKLRNGDAHLKNFSLMYHNESDIHLSPLYDVVNTLVYPIGFDKFGKPTNDNFAMPLERGGSKDFPLTVDLIKFGEKLGLSSQFCKESIERIEESLYETLRDNKSRFTHAFYTQFTDSVNMSDKLTYHTQSKSDFTFLDILPCL